MVEINDDASGTYHKFMLKSSSCDYSDACMFVGNAVPVAELVADGGNNNIQVVFKSCAPFTDCISEINSTQIDNAKDIKVVKPMYDLIEYRNNYLKTPGSLCQYYRNKLALTDGGALDHFLVMALSLILNKKY